MHVALLYVCSLLQTNGRQDQSGYRRTSGQRREHVNSLSLLLIDCGFSLYNTYYIVYECVRVAEAYAYRPMPIGLQLSESSM